MCEGNQSDRAALERFVIDNQDFERLEGLLGEFNLFEAIGAVRQELRHSDTLRFLFDPLAPHGIGPAFLSRFLKSALAGTSGLDLGPVEVDVSDLTATQVIREWRNIDILLLNDEARFAVAIENKIGTGEHSNQLARYRETLAAEFPDHRRVHLFLTPDGDRPSDEVWIPVDYGLVADTLEGILETYATRIGPDAATLMGHYLSMLRRHIVSDSDISRLCRDIYEKHRQALDLIFEHRPDQVARLAAEFRRVIEGSGEAGIVVDHITKASLKFGLEEWDQQPWQKRGGGWTKSGRLLLFEIYVADKSSSMHLYIGPGEDSARRAVFEAFTAGNKPRLKGGRPKLTTTYTTVYSVKWKGAEAMGDLTDEELAKTIDAQWAAFIDKDLPKIREVASGIHGGG